MFVTLERNSCAELNLPPRSGGFSDGAELRRIDEAVWRSEIDVIQSVEKLRAELKPKSFTQSELAHDGWMTDGWDGWGMDGVRSKH